jgi:TRAP-type mannitol/chloroaromatic compound transport system permease large subunit
MSNEYLGLILLGALLVGIFAGFPIAFTLIILSVVFGYIGFGDTVFRSSSSWGTCSSRRG